MSDFVLEDIENTVIENLSFQNNRSEQRFYFDNGMKRAYINEPTAFVIQCIKAGKDYEQIALSFNEKFQKDYNTEDITVIIDTYVRPLYQKNYKTRGVFKLLKFFNPDKFTFKSQLAKTVPASFFYFAWCILLVANLVPFLLTSFTGLTSISEQIIFYLSLFLILVFHEIGHVAAGFRYGITSKDIGFGFYLILPVFYTNLTEIWKIRQKERNIVNLSGIYYQLFIGVGLFAVGYFCDSNLVLNIAHSNFFIVVINLNPLLKFDGYWVLADFIDEPNLMRKTRLSIKSLRKEKRTVQIYTLFHRAFMLYIIILVILMCVRAVYSIRAGEHTFMNYLSIFLVVSFIISIIYNSFRNVRHSKK